MRLPSPGVAAPTEEDFPSRWHDERVAARVGLWLGICFGVCFLTGLLSHLIQHPTSWFVWPTRPVSLYRVTQGLHVATGTAAVPLLLVKLWTIYPKLFARPAVGSLVRAAERGSVLLLVGAAFFELVTGVQNVAHWYPWGFGFPVAHYAVAWVAVGSILLHVAVKLPAIRRGLAARVETAGEATGPSRRWLLGGAAAGVAVATLATAGTTVPLLRRVSVLGVRSGSGVQGVPVNKSAASAGVLETAVDEAWRLQVSGPGGSASFSRADLLEMPQTTAELPIACVEGWSASATWTGVRLRDVLAAAGLAPDGDVHVQSLQEGGAYSRSTLPARHVGDDLTLLALKLGDEDLDVDHGYPCRLIAPSRPGVLQTKWLSTVEVLA